MNEKKRVRRLEYAGVALVLFLCVSAESLAGLLVR